MAELKKENDSSFVRVFIERDDPRAVALSRDDAKQIEQYILEQICANLGKQLHLCFSGPFLFSEEGALIVSPNVHTLSWLQEVIKGYSKKTLRITDFKDRPQYTAKVGGEFPRWKKLIELLGVQNVGLQTNNWRILSVDHTISCGMYVSSYVTLLIDDLGSVFLQRNNFKLFLGMSTIKCKLLERVRRCEITGSIVPDEVKLAGVN